MKLNIELESFEELSQILKMVRGETMPHMAPVTTVKIPQQNVEEFKNETPQHFQVETPDNYTWVRMSEAAEKLHKAKNTLSYHISRANLPKKIAGGITLVALEPLMKYLKEHSYDDRSEKPAKPASEPMIDNPKRPYKEFHDELIDEITTAGFSRDTDYKWLMSRTYAYMTKHYGIVWEQVRKDYKILTGKTVIATTLLAHWLEETNQITYKLTASCLASVCKEARDEHNEH